MNNKESVPSSGELKRGLIYCADLMYCSQITGVSRPSGQELAVAYSADQFRDAIGGDDVYTFILIDLEAVATHLEETVAQIRSASAAAVIIGFGPHVHTDTLAAAEAAGFDRVLSRGELFRGAATLFQTFV